MPPNHGKGWPLPDGKKLPSPSKQTKTKDSAKRPSSRSPRKPVQNQQRVQGPPTRPPPEPPRGKASNGTTTLGKTQRQSAVDDVLVDAISRGVAKQLRLFSFSSNKTTPRQTRKPSAESRTPSQREALDRFTKELKRHANQVGAKGKVPVFTPTPAMSPDTFRTVSALMPYRSEFRAAGLAVTSKDQAQRCAITAKQTQKSPPTRGKQPLKETHQSNVSQMDGRQDTGESQSPVIDFVRSKSVESWRHALIDQAPVIPPRKQSLLALKGSKRLSHCMPCFNQASTSASSAHGNDGRKGRTTQASYAAHAPSKERPRTPHGSRPRDNYRPPRIETEGTKQSHRELPSRPERLQENRQRPRPSKPATEFPRRRPQGLRRRSLTLNSLIYPDPHPVGKRVPGRTKRLPSGMPRAGDASLDLIPQASGNMDLHRFTERQYTSLPGENMDGRMPRAGGFEPAKSMPNVPRTRKQTNGPSPVPNSAPRRPTPRDHNVSKAAYAAQEIARHSLGPYPTGIPKPRQPSAVYDRPRGPPRERSSLLGARRATPGGKFEDIKDRDVLRGLHVAAAAACDESLDGLVHQKTGVHVRRFLADLMAFESLGFEQPGEDPEERARRRRSQMRKLKQHVHKSREDKRKSALLT